MTKLSAESMKDLPFTSASLLEALRNTKDKLTGTEHAVVKYYVQKIQNVLKETASPYQRWVEEYVSLVVLNDVSYYQQMLSNYIRFLHEEKLIKGYHIQGLADLLSLAQSNDWLTAHDGQQILDFLTGEKATVVLDIQNKSTIEMYQYLALWQQMLYALTKVHTVITESQKTAIRSLLRKYRKHFEAKKDNVGLQLVSLAKQSLLYTKDSGPSVKQKSAVYLLSAFKNLSQAAAAVGNSPATMGVSSLGAISPLIDGIQDIASLSKLLYQHIQDKKQSKDWYELLTELQSYLIASVYKNDLNSFQSLIGGLKNIVDKELKLALVHGLLDTFIQILIAWPTKEYQEFHHQSYELFEYFINELNDNNLDARLFAATAKLGATNAINISFIGLWVDYLKKRWADFEKMPLDAGVLGGIVWFYQAIDQLKQNPASTNEERAGWTNLQKLLLERIVAEFNTSGNERILAAFCIIDEAEEIKDKKPLQSITEQLSHHPGGQKALEHAKKDRALKSGIIKQPSLLLTVWMVLQPEQRNHLIAIHKKLFGKTKVSTQANKKTAFLANEIGKLVVGVMVGTTGTLICEGSIPKTETGAKSLAVLLNALEPKFDVNKPILADKIGFSFIANYIEGLQIGTDKHLLKEAIRLAETYLSKEEQEASASIEDKTTISKPTTQTSSSTPSVAQLISQIPDSPINAGQASTTNQGLKSDCFTLLEDDLTVDIDLDGLVGAGFSLQVIQEVLKSNRGIQSRFHKSYEKLDNEDGSIDIYQISFKTKKAAETLIEELNKKISKQPKATSGVLPL